MPFVSNLWSIVVSSALSIVTSFIVSVFTVFLKDRSDQRLELHKAQLTSQNAREIENIKSEGVIAAERFKKSYGLLADRQADAVENMYSNLVAVHQALLWCVNIGSFGGEPNDAQSVTNLHEERWKGYMHFRKKRLFIPSDLASKIDELYSKIGESEMQFRFLCQGNNRKSKDWDRQGELWDNAKGPMVAALNGLEQEFRLLLHGKTD